jgi:hypothetical protein
MRPDRERHHRARVTSTVGAARDVQIADQRADDKEAAPRIAHDVLRQPRVVGEAGAAIERVQDRDVTADVKRELDLLAAVTHHVAEQFAKDEFGQTRVGIGRPTIVQHGNDLLPSLARCYLVTDGKYPARVAF